MTKDEALRLALEALEAHADIGIKADKAITAIKAALEAKDEQLREENERLHVENRRLIDRIETIGVPVGVGGWLTTTMAHRTWVGLTDDELFKIWMGAPSETEDRFAFVNAVIAKLKEKNT
jgi:hypothetical protein